MVDLDNNNLTAVKGHKGKSLLFKSILSYFIGIMILPLFSLAYYLGATMWISILPITFSIANSSHWLFPQIDPYSFFHYIFFVIILTIIVSLIVNIFIVLFKNTTIVDSFSRLDFNSNIKARLCVKTFIKHILFYILFIGIQKPFAHEIFQYISIALIVTIIISDFIIRIKTKGSSTLLLKIVNLEHKK